MFDSADVRQERFWRVGIARNAVFFRSFLASKARKGRSEKRGGAKDRLPKMSTKFAPRLRARAIWKSKSLKTGMPGALLEVDIDQICTTPARESDLEVKIVKNWHDRSTFGSWASQNLHHACARERFGSQNNWRSRDVFWGSKCVLRGRRRDFDTLQNTWQAQEFVRVAKTLAGVGDLKRVWNDAFRVAGARISRSVMSMFEASDAETVEGLQISCHGSVTLQWSFRVAVTGLRMPRLNFFVAGAVLLKHPLKNR